MRHGGSSVASCKLGGLKMTYGAPRLGFQGWRRKLLSKVSWPRKRSLAQIAFLFPVNGVTIILGITLANILWHYVLQVSISELTRLSILAVGQWMIIGVLLLISYQRVCWRLLCLE
jgi:hypothetical protein